MKSKLMNLTLVGAMAVSLCLAGCGNRLPAAAPDEVEAGVEEPIVEEPVSELPTTPTVPTTPAYEEPPVVTGSLVVSNVEKDKKGIILLSRKMEVTGTVINTSNVPLSGTLKVEFKKKKGIINKSLETSETKTQVLAAIQPGASFPFTVTSDKNCDDVEVTVETNTPAPAATAGAYGAPYGAQANPYGAPQNPYGAASRPANQGYGYGY